MHRPFKTSSLVWSNPSCLQSKMLYSLCPPSDPCPALEGAKFEYLAEFEVDIATMSHKRAFSIIIAPYIRLEPAQFKDMQRII